MKKICLLLTIIMISSCFICIYKSYAADDSIVDKLSAMSNVTKPDTTGGVVSGKGIPNAINRVIGLMQLVGSGIAIIVVTLLGVKYILASPSDKADVKKSITPIIIGCALLFGGVNIAATIADFSEQVMGD